MQQEKSPGRKVNLTGDRYGRWVVVGPSEPVNPKRPKWICRCDCGVSRSVAQVTLRSGTSTSCGCTATEQRRTHGKSKTSEYHVWRGIIERCCNVSSRDFPTWGGRGITVCSRWRDSFQSFIDDMGPRPNQTYTIDRIDNNEGYNPGNCRWATKTEQGRNRRTNFVIEFGGVSKTLIEWSESTGFSRVVIADRLHRGWDVESAMTIKPTSSNSWVRKGVHRNPDPGPPKNCSICRLLYKPLRQDRCNACYKFFRRTGADKVFPSAFSIVESDELADSVRGSGGFGSSGLR